MDQLQLLWRPVVEKCEPAGYRQGPYPPPFVRIAPQIHSAKEADETRLADPSSAGLE
jgi:hypothetical protein